MRIIVHDVDRPDVNGTPPKMQAIRDNAAKVLTAPCLVAHTDDNLMSCVIIRGSLDQREDWPSGIFENSRYFRFMLSPAKHRRYYDEGDKVTVELCRKSHKLAVPFRKSTTTPDKAIERIREWLDKAG